MTFLRSPTVAVFGCFALAGAVMTIDWAYPEQVQFETLYLVLVAALTWRAGWPSGSALSATTIIFLTCDALAPHDLGGATVAWNTIWWTALYAGLVVLVHRLAAAQRRLRDLAHTDPLTGLANRRYFDAVVGAELDRARRYQRPASLAVLDVNGFKAFNDTRGHLAGDGMLRRISADLHGGLRSTDIIARIGGDEFAVLFPETTPRQAHAALAHATASLQDVYPPGLSYGVIECDDAAATPTALLAGGDEAMYRAKRAYTRRNAP
jgi:diguanylate cyclase (GGDEF)-like protein